MSDDDASQIRRLLEDRIESVLDSLAPGWIKRGGTAYLTPKSNKDLGSFTVSLRDGQRMPRGCWFRFSQGIGGGSVELVSFITTGRKDAYREAFKWSRQFLGLAGEQADDADREAFRRRQEQETLEREARNRKHAAETERKKEQRAASAAEVWNESVALKGSHADAYLQARGIAPVETWPWDCAETLRFHPALDYELDREAGRFPALVCKVVDAFGELTAIWGVYIDPKSAAKAKLEPNKVGRGPAAGGAVRIGGDGPRIDASEGVESALGAWELDHFSRPSWSLLSTSGMVSFEPPIFIKEVRTWPDADRGKLNRETRAVEGDPPGLRAAKTMHEHLVSAGIKNPINDMTRFGDSLEMLVARKVFDRKSA